MEYDTEIDISKAHEEYDAKVKNLEGIFKKVRGLFDVKKYEQELANIIAEVESNEELKKEREYFQTDITYSILKGYIDRVDSIVEKLNEDYVPFYEIYLLSSKIDSMLSNVTADNIDEIISDTKALLEAMRKLNHEGKPERIKVIEDAYRTVYGVILHEEEFELSVILDYIKDKNSNIDRENLGRLIEKDINKLDIKDVFAEELEGIHKDGLGYDYLSKDFVSKLSKKVVGNPNSLYQERKRESIRRIADKAQDLQREKNRVVAKRELTKKELKNLRITMTKVYAKLLAFVLIPVMTYSAGKGIGRAISNNITEYQAITRTINAETKQIVDGPEITWEEQNTAYVASVIVKTPWRKNPAGVGYIRNATVYEYITPDDVSDDYHISVEDLEGNVLEKYGYIEPKDTLDATDSMTDVEVLITETYKGNETRKSSKFVWPGAIVGLVSGLIIQVILGILLSQNGIGINEIKMLLGELDEKIRDKKLTTKELTEEILKIKEKAMVLVTEHNDVVKKYNLDSELLLPEIEELTASLKRKRNQ